MCPLFALRLRRASLNVCPCNWHARKHRAHKHTCIIYAPWPKLTTPTALFTGAEEEAHRGPQSMQEHQTRVPRAQLRRARPPPRKMLQGVRSRPHQQ